MTTSELQRILGYVNVGLAIAHDRGVSIGHFENVDFIQLAEMVNSMLLHAVTVERDEAELKASAVASVAAPVASVAVAVAPVVLSKPAVSSAAAAS